MTLVLTARGKTSIWICADRRLTHPDWVRNDACKLLQIDGTDGTALLGYAGLGSSAMRQTQPSDWMSDVLRGQYGLTVEQQLNLLADATKADMPPHLTHPQGPKGHHLLAAAKIDGRPQLYSIRCELHPGEAEPRFEYTRYVREKSGKPPWFAAAGSGAAHLSPGKRGQGFEKEWMRQTVRMIEGVEERGINPLAVADRLAAVNHRISLADPFVSPQCIVIWRANTGAGQSYNGLQRVEPDLIVPSVVTGIDMRELAAVSLSSWPALDTLEPGKMRKIDIEAHRRAMQACLNGQDSKPKRRL